MKILLTLLLGSLSITAPSQTAIELTAHGRYREAAKAFEESAESALDKQDQFAAAKAYLNAANCLKMDGNLSPAFEALGKAERFAKESSSKGLQGRLLACRGSILSLGKYPSQALVPLEAAAQIASATGDVNLYLETRNDAGIAASSAGHFQQAVDYFNEVELLATDAQREDLRQRARQNHLIATFQLWQESRISLDRIQEVGGYDGPAYDVLQASETAFENSLDLSVADIASQTDVQVRIYHGITAGLCSVRYGKEKQGFGLLREALSAARKSDSPDLLCSALLALTELYLENERENEAQILLGEAQTLEGRLDSSLIAHLDILNAIAKHASSPGEPKTLTSIERAIASIGKIRSDLARSQNITDLGRTFRQHAGKPYLLLADHYLQQSPPRPEKAREAIELFKRWELDDFFRDNCINLALQSASDLRVLSEAEVGVLYFIPLNEGTEVLLTTAKETQSWRSPISADKLYRLARTLRHSLEFDYGTYSYQEVSKEIYTGLLQPGEHLLAGLKHLVIVPDGPLGNVPFSCLINPRNNRFLLEDFSLSLAPSLELLPPGNTEQKEPKALLGGISLPLDGFSPLPGVKRELKILQPLYATSPPLLDQRFTISALKQSIQQPSVNIVHLGTHGEFGGRAEDSFLLTHSDSDESGVRLSLDQLEELIRPKKFRGNPVELLCLSACRTARGNDRASLGLAGAAVKSGSRSVAATLWYVSDSSSVEIITAFHRNYQAGLSKAEALRKAQLDFLYQHRSDSGSHPYHWAPFVLVGDWH